MREFIEAILGDTSGNAVMAIATGRTPAGKLAVNAQRWFKYPEQIDEMVAYAEQERTGDRRNVYLSPIIYGDELVVDKKTKEPKPLDRDGNPQFSRSTSNAVAASVIYMDSDLCPPGAFRLPPSIHVDTSPGHGHDYWTLDAPVTAQQAAEVAHRITTAHEADGCDPSGWSANKFLRMPTVNTKDPLNPYPITWEQSGEVYALEDLELAYPTQEQAAKNKAEVVAYAGEVDEGEVPALEDLPDHTELLQRIPQSERRLNDLIFKKPMVGEKGWRSEQRFGLLLDLIRFGFTLEETVAIAWHSPAASKWRTDQRGVDGLWWEARKAYAQVHYERGVGVAAEAADELRQEKAAVNPIVLVTADERLAAASRVSWLDEYIAWCESRFTISNRPFHKMMGWQALSAAFAAVAYVPKPSGRMHLNLYGFGIGGSSTGKTDSIRCYWDVVGALHPNDSPDIGGNHSENALIERLLAREGKVSVQWVDEADGTLAVWKKGDWSMGVQSTITKVYDGFVPQMSRVGKQDLQKSNARAYVNSFMFGTPEGLFRVLDRGMFLTGFLARQVWAIGEELPVTKESMKTKQQAIDLLHDEDPRPKMWADRFARTVTMLRANLPAGQKLIPLLFTDEALERFDEAKWKIHLHFLHHPDQDIFKTAVRRLADIMWKASALTALADGSRWITTAHVTQTLIAVEEWIYALEVVAGRISSSAFSRACDEIEAFVAGHKDQRVEATKVYKLRNHESVRQTDEYLTALQRQGRIVEITPNTSTRFYQIAGQAQPTAPVVEQKTSGAPSARTEDDDDYPFDD